MPANVILGPLLLPFFRSALKKVSGAENLPPSGGYIIAANHVDWLDGFFVSTALDRIQHRPVKFLTTSNNYRWTGMAVQIPQNKSDIIASAVMELKKGNIVCNFPEGRRNPTDTLYQGKTGTVRMAALAHVPVIPLGISTPFFATMRKSLVNVSKKNYTVKFNFGQPITFGIPPGGITEEWLDQETARLMRAIASLSGKRYNEGN